MAKKTTINISGMHCTSCAMTIDFDLEDTPGIKEAKTNYAKRQVEVVYDENQVTLEQILAVIKKTGYGTSLDP